MDRQMLRHRSRILHSTRGSEQGGDGQSSRRGHPRSLSSSQKQGAGHPRRSSLICFWCHRRWPPLTFGLHSWGGWVLHHPPALFPPCGQQNRIQHHGQLPGGKTFRWPCVKTIRQYWEMDRDQKEPTFPRWPGFPLRSLPVPAEGSAPAK